jgi:hypothetical protein
MKGYKAFSKGMVCIGKQYAENTTFEEEEAVICSKGMHFCKDPLDVLDYYPLVDENGDIAEFAEVEALDVCHTDDNKKFCTRKLHIGAKIDFPQLVSLALGDITQSRENSGDGAQIASSGYEAKIASSNDETNIASSGNWANIASSGNWANIGSSGNRAQIGSSGNWANIGSSGNRAQIGSSGDWVQIASSGHWANIGSSGYRAKIASSGDGAKIGSSGDIVQIGSSGKGAKIASSGDGGKIVSTGENSVICCAGKNSIVKGKIGSWITLAEWCWVDGEYKPICVKTEYIDGVRIKEDVFYALKNKEFVEVG